MSESGGNLDGLRRSNLASVLRFVHRHNGASRAELTRATDLNRSTIAGIVRDLVERGWVLEQAGSANGIGRPSPRVVPHPHVQVLVVNPEIDMTQAALVGMGGQVFAHGHRSHSSAPSPAEVVEVTRQLLAELWTSTTGHLGGIVIAVPGMVEPASGVVALAPHLRWREVPLGSMVAAATGVTTMVRNDAHCGVIAETSFGAARGLEHVLYLNGGASGIGGGVVIAAQLHLGSHGHGGEIGHVQVVEDGPNCHCGGRGCLETQVNRATVQRALTARARTEFPATAQSSTLVTSLGVALRTTVNILDPQAIILGGFLSELAQEIGLEQLRRELETALPGGRECDIRQAALGDDILFVGAAEFLLERLIAEHSALVGSDSSQAHSHP